MSADSLAQTLTAHIRSIADFILLEEEGSQADHAGAVITDAVLQAGLRYETVVAPRVRHVAAQYPQAQTLDGFLDVLTKHGANVVLQWKGGRKPGLVLALTRFLVEEGNHTVEDLRNWIASDDNARKLLALHGVGPKTVDYLRLLLGIDTSAIDRHVLRFLREAGLDAPNYATAKRIVDEMADLLGLSRARLDHSIWAYMANRKPPRRETPQPLTRRKAEA